MTHKPWIQMVLVLCIVSSAVDSAKALSVAGECDSLRLLESDKAHTIVQLKMPEALYRKVIAARGEKLRFENASLVFNNDSLAIKEITLHGNTTLYYERKSFSVETKKKVKLCGKGCKPVGAFYLISLSMDRNYFHNRLCFDMLRELDLFPLQYTFAEVKINDHSQGIYLVMQRPQDWSLKTIESPVIIRRGADHRIDKMKAGKGVDKQATKLYRQRFNTIYTVIKHLSGEQLYTRLNEIIDIREYMRWLAFNYVVRNGDYSDELYLYADPKTGRFRIIPWDYDDIFHVEPHEGLKEWKAKMNPSSLIFSSEDALDVKIAHDPYLYTLYLQTLVEVLKQLDKTKTEQIINALYADLSSLYNTPGILAVSSKDGYSASLESLRTDLWSVYTHFNGERGMITTLDVSK